jgi:hypothetical protein
MEELVVNGKVYRIGQLPAMDAFHLGRKLLPLHLAAENIIAELSKMSTEDAELTINICLAVATRQQPGGTWAPVFNRGSKRIMFDDMTAEDLFKIMMATAKANKVVDFFTLSGPTSPTGEKKA